MLEPPCSLGHVMSKAFAIPLHFTVVTRLFMVLYYLFADSHYFGPKEKRKTNKQECQCHVEEPSTSWHCFLILVSCAVGRYPILHPACHQSHNVPVSVILAPTAAKNGPTSVQWGLKAAVLQFSMCPCTNTPESTSQVLSWVCWMIRETLKVGPNLVALP